MTITLTGATGFLGRRLVQRLRQDGHELRLLTRKAALDEPGLRHFVWGDSTSAEPPSEALDGSDAVVHLAGEPVVQRWNEDVKRRIRESRVEGTRRLVQALSTQSRRPATLVSASAIGYYGLRGDEVLTESSRPGDDFLAQVCRDWEQQADLAGALGMRVVKLRIGVVLGPEGGALPKMLPPFRLGVGGKLGSGRQWMSWIHIEDLISLFAAVLEDSRWQGTVNATAPHPVRNEEFTAALGEALHRPAFLPVPKLALRLLYGEMAEVVLASQRVLPNAAEAARFSFRFRELRPALQHLLSPE